MELKYKVGDLLGAAVMRDVNVIAHGCNCFNTMASGIAPLVAKQFPGAQRVDRATVRGDRAKLGTLTSDFDSTYNVLVFNLYTQYDYKGRRQGIRDLHYDAMRSAFKAMAASLRAKMRILDLEYSDFKIGLPKIGAGLAGGEWSLIAPIIKEELRNFDVTIYVLKEKEIPR